MYYWTSKEKVLIEITKLKWRYVEDYDFYDVFIQLDGYAEKRIYINSHRLTGLDMLLPEAIEYLLRAKMNCQPERGVEKTVDKR